MVENKHVMCDAKFGIYQMCGKTTWHSYIESLKPFYGKKTFLEGKEHRTKTAAKKYVTKMIMKMIEEKSING